MDFRKYYLDEIMNLESDNSVSLINSFAILNKFAEVKLINDDDNNLYFECKVDDIINSDIENEDLIEVRNAGWKYNDKKDCIIKIL